MACPEPTVVILYYNVEDFFDLSSIESMYRSDLDQDRMGITNLDYRALTNNDRQFFDVLLKRAASECYSVLQSLVKGAAEGFGYKSLPVRTVDQLNDLVAPEDNMYFQLADAGTLDFGNVAVVAGDKVYFNGTIWVKDNATAPSYIFYSLNLPYNFDLNNQFGLDDKVKEFITMFVVYHWFRRQKYDLSLIEQEYKENRADLGRIVNYRISIKRPVRTF